jgi:cation diffusion facilitator CzcD-associated flavoprotein CzcO
MKMMSPPGSIVHEIEADANGDFTPSQIARFKADPEFYEKFTKALELDACTKFAVTLNKSSPQQQWAAEKAREFMTAMLGGNESLCKALIPTFAVGCRRLTPAPGYLESLRSPNVEVVTDGIRRVVPRGLELEDGRIIEVEAIVCATGFDHSFRPPFPIVGRKGNLQDVWTKETPTAYMSLAVPGMPNYFSKHSPAQKCCRTLYG